MNDYALALNAIDNVINNDKKSNEEINLLASDASNLGYVTRLVYGVLENKLYLDYMIEKLSTTKLKKIQKKVLIILEIGIYSIHFLDKKDYSIVNELVDLTKKTNKRASGFVNAVLRNFIRDEKEISTIYERDDLKSLSIRFSLPLELTHYIYDNYGMEYTKNFLKFIIKEQDISIRVNKVKTNKEDLAKKLVEKGYQVLDGRLSDNSLIVKNPSGLVRTSEFKEGLFTIQQESSMKAVEILDPRANTKILDLCAAPGTKTSYMAEYTNNESYILANDLIASKLELINQNINRLGLKNIDLTSFDASTYNEDLDNKFDYCLVDAPCSGLGVMGRKPEIRYNRSIEDIKNLAKVQRDVLDQAIKYLKVGGILVYSTCTIGDIENKENFEFLLEKENLKHLPIEGKDYIEYHAFKEGTDGFFISRFEKI